MCQNTNVKQVAANRYYRLFFDAGHGWLEVPRAEVIAAGANISRRSHYDPLADKVYLEEACDVPEFFEATGQDWGCARRGVYSSAPRSLPCYTAEAVGVLA
jgi:hypothetical protein